MKKNIVIGCGIFIVILLIAGTGIWIRLMDLGKLYDQVWANMPSVEQKLIALNHATLSQIQQPEGVTVTEQKELGLDTHNSYGVSTFVGYSIADPKFDVQLYYRTLMNKSGWVLVDSFNATKNAETTYAIYNNKTACVMITTYPPENQVYNVEVYQDFRKQDFSPKLPPDWYLVLRQGGQNDIDHCP
jgi:hypothetical protein